MSHRIQRLNSLIRQEISELLLHVKDPRLGNFIAITEVDTTPDLKHAKVFISFLGDEEKRQTTLDALTKASGFFRRELGGSIKIRRIPELSFHWDDSIERGDRLARLLDRVSSEHEE